MMNKRERTVAMEEGGRGGPGEERDKEETENRSTKEVEQSTPKKHAKIGDGEMPNIFYNSFFLCFCNIPRSSKGTGIKK